MSDAMKYSTPPRPARLRASRCQALVEGKCIPLDKMCGGGGGARGVARAPGLRGGPGDDVPGVIVGSGYHGDILSPDDGVALLGNTLRRGYSMC